MALALTPPNPPDQVYALTTGQDVHAATPQEVAEAEYVWWTVQAGTPLGAWFLMYVTHPIQAFCWLGRTVSLPHKPAGMERHVAWTELVELQNPVPMAEVRADPIAGTWSAIRNGGRLQGRSRRVQQPAVWARLLELAVSRNPGLKSVIADWSSRAPSPVLDPLEDAFWEGGPGYDYPFHSERPLQRALYEVLLDDGFRAPEELGLSGWEPRIGTSGRADLLLWQLEPEPPALVVIETKIFATTTHGVDQAARYADALIELAPEGTEILAYVVAQEFSQFTIERADEVGVDLVRVAWADGDRSEWVYGPLEA